MAGRSLLSSRTMTALRRLDERAMPDTATLIRPEPPVANGRGGTTPWISTSRTIVGRFSHGAGDGVGQRGELEADVAELVRRGATARFKVAVVEDVNEGDELISGGQRYNIIYAPTPTAYTSSRLLGLKLIGAEPV